jgi:hypothetical protein
VISMADDHISIPQGGRHSKVNEAWRGIEVELNESVLGAELVRLSALVSNEIHLQLNGVERNNGILYDAANYFMDFGEKITLLAGDLLIALAIRIVGKHGNPEYLQYLGKGAIRTCEQEAIGVIDNSSSEIGTAVDSLNSQRKPLSLLYEAALVGALIGGASEDQTDALLYYAENLDYILQMKENATPDFRFKIDAFVKDAKNVLHKQHIEQTDLMLHFVDFALKSEA